MEDGAQWTCFGAIRSDTILPDSLTELDRLEVLKVGMQSLRKGIPENIGRLGALRYLWLASGIALEHQANDVLSSPVPSSLVNLKALKSLRLEGTGLTSWNLPLPSSGEVIFPELEEFSLHLSASISTDVSIIFQTSKKLRIVDLHRAAATSFKVQYVCDLPQLTIFNVGGSLAYPSITDTFWNTLPSLELISFNSPGLSGTIGEGISTMKNLSVLHLVSVKVRGTIPSSIAHLPLKSLILVDTRLSGPLPEHLEHWAPTLTNLEIARLGGTNELPESIGALHKLELLRLTKCGLRGTLPAGLANASQLKSIFLADNHLNGTLPALNSSRLTTIDLSHNRFSGTIPHTLASNIYHLTLDFNELGPILDPNVLLDRPNLAIFSVSHNRFVGSLPPASDNYLILLDLSFNEFLGPVPESYCYVDTLRLSHNILQGFNSNHCRKAITSRLYLDHNRFEGVLDLSSYHSLQVLDVSHNQFSGAFPAIPSSLIELKASYNQFSGENIENVLVSSSLHDIDLAGNGFTLNITTEGLVGPNVTFLSLAHNILQVEREGNLAWPNLLALDLTNTSFNVPLGVDYMIAPNLGVLLLAQNNMNYNLGALLKVLPYLTQLDISDNKFEFDVSIFTGLPLLTMIKARNNRLYGSLALDSSLSSIQLADFSANELQHEPDLVSIGIQFSEGHLEVLNISSNPLLLTISDMNTPTTGLMRSQLSAPSSLYRDTLTCYQLTFWNESAIYFLHDEDLFDFAQCDCNSQHFGFPPTNCYKCPSSGMNTCGGRHANVSRNYYVFEASNSSSSLFFETESCLVTVVHTITGLSNCLGDNITASDLEEYIASKDVSSSLDVTNSLSPSDRAPHASSSHHNASHILQRQCAVGSEGRLCSRCKCQPDGRGECWYEGAATCTKCFRVFSYHQSIPLVLGLFLGFIIFLSPIMTLILRRKRTQSLESYNKLPLWKRMFYRAMYLTTLGNVSILITFLQMMIEFTQWDAYARVQFFGAINGGGEKYVALWVKFETSFKHAFLKIVFIAFCF